MSKILITGANRGIGFEMTRQLVERGETIFATCRDPQEATKLQQLSQQAADQLHIVQMDVADDESVAEAFTAVSQITDSLDWVINNAGINLRQGFDQFNAKDMLLTLNINAVGSMRIATTFVDLLRNGTEPRLINISSQLGSLERARPGWGTYGYNSSKSAMNMITRHLSFDLGKEGITVITMHPGWVQTDMGGKDAAVTISDSAAGIIHVVSELSPDDNGKFFVYSGEEHPW